MASPISSIAAAALGSGGNCLLRAQPCWKILYCVGSSEDLYLIAWLGGNGMEWDGMGWAIGEFGRR